MDLFGATSATNLLPRDGTVRYYGPILPATDTQQFYSVLLETTPWKRDEVVLFGRRIVTARAVAWYGDAGYNYTYSGTTKRAFPWTDELRTLKAFVEDRTGATFNSCLLNLYHDGTEGISWHSDNEKTLVPRAPIASLSFGAERKFCFKHKHDPTLTTSVVLESGSLLVMEDETQEHWLHSIPKSAKITTPRINLTFRTMVRPG